MELPDFDLTPVVIRIMHDRGLVSCLKLNGNKIHCEEGPAVIWENGTREWWLNNVRHRADGPALIKLDGYREWWLNGTQVDPLVVFLKDN